MDVVRKDATITSTAADEAFPGTFRVVLSAPTRDRDGDLLLAEEWKQPLPDHITFDVDHEMSVRGTIGSGKPWIDWNNEVGAGKGAMIVDGTFSKLQHAQDARTLVNEGHINRTSVAFMTQKTQKDGKSTIQRELLNGALVAIPSNREAVILSSKAADVKAGARNSKSDAERIQAIHDHAAALGATHEVDVPSDAPDVAKSLQVKDAEDGTDPVALISATDAAIDEALDLFAQVDLETLPAQVQQAIALIQAADVTVDELLDALGITDPDEDADSGAVDTSAAGASKDAPAAEVKAAPVEVTDSDVLDRFLQIRVNAFQ